jgi:hypothetical protein
LLVLFVLIHVVMVFVAGFRSRMRAMITGRAEMASVGADALIRPAEAKRGVRVTPPGE